jgi:hypothetical protein
MLWTQKEWRIENWQKIAIWKDICFDAVDLNNVLINLVLAAVWFAEFRKRLQIYTWMAEHFGQNGPVAMQYQLVPKIITSRPRK